MAMDKQLLQNAVDQATANYNTYASSYRELREVYQREYGANWNKQLAHDYAQQAHVQEASGRKQINRYEAFLRGSSSPQARNPDRPTGRTKEALREVGRTQEPIKKDAPPDGLRFTVDMKVKKDSEHSSARTRQADIYMDYQTAVKFIQDPNYYDLFNEWYDGGGDNYGEDGDYEADIYSVSAA